MTAAFAATTGAAVAIITELNRQIPDLETILTEHFETHPDADIYRTLPGLGVVLGARVLGEFRDDPTGPKLTYRGTHWGKETLRLRTGSGPS